MTIILIKLFFITFFIAELIIALAVILKIHSFNKYINNLNAEVLALQRPIKRGFKIARILIYSLNKAFCDFRQQVQIKKQEYLLKFLKTSIVYGGIFFLKGKYKKIILGYQFIREVYEGIKEAS